MIGADWLKALKLWRAELQKLRDEIERRKQRLEYLEAAPPPREDVIDQLLAEVDRFADKFGDHLVAHARQVFSANPLRSVRPSLSEADTGWPFLAHRHGNRSTVHIQLLTSVLAPLLKDAIRRAMADAEWPDAGPPLADRQREIARLEREIADLEAQLATMQQTAEEQGIRL